jgi:NAD(P)-dependent dehydrogenase (short-subunit alcohol dehydrogenase family)
MKRTAMFDFTGTQALITGSTRGIGRGIAESLIECGADVMINSRSKSDINTTVQELQSCGKGNVAGCSADLGNVTDRERLINETLDQFGRIDLLVNNAAMFPDEESMIDESLDRWNSAISVNLTAPFHLTSLVASDLVESERNGTIINITSQTGDRRAGNRGIYGLSKTALNGLTWRMAYDLAKYGIRVNAVSTGATFSSQLTMEAETEAEKKGIEKEVILDQWAKEIPLDRLGTPEDIAHAVLFLASEEADYITGEILRVSGGRNLQ